MNRIKFTIQRVAELEKRVYSLFDMVTELTNKLKSVASLTNAGQEASTTQNATVASTDVSEPTTKTDV